MSARDEGFVLWDAFAALAAAAIIASGLVAALRTSVVASREAETRARALALAELALTQGEDGAGPEAGEAGALSWTRDIQPYAFDPAYEIVVVRVSWRSNASHGETKLETLRRTRR